MAEPNDIQDILDGNNPLPIVNQNNAIIRALLAALITATEEFIIVDGSITNAKLASGIDATKLSSGLVSNSEFDYLNGATSNIQTQLNVLQSALNTLSPEDIEGLAALLAPLAPLASPNLTGAPTAPTAVQGTNTTQIATTAFVAGCVAALVNSSPSALDTLNELAAALGNDANFATTVTNSIADKLSKSANLSDLPNPATARVNLGLTMAAFTNVANTWSETQKFKRIEFANPALQIADYGGILEVAPDSDNPGATAFYLGPKIGGARVFVGREGAIAYSLSFKFCQQLENLPNLLMGNSYLSWGGTDIRIFRDGDGIAFQSSFGTSRFRWIDETGEVMRLQGRKLGLGVSSPHSTLHTTGSATVGSVDILLAPTTLTAAHRRLWCITSGANFNQTLPNADDCEGRDYTFIKPEAAHQLTVSPLAGQGEAITLHGARSVVRFVAKDGEWWVEFLRETQPEETGAQLMEHTDKYLPNPPYNENVSIYTASRNVRFDLAQAKALVINPPTSPTRFQIQVESGNTATDFAYIDYTPGQNFGVFGPDTDLIMPLAPGDLLRIVNNQSADPNIKNLYFNFPGRYL